jgi:pimeloyl-ACP methyl ester carboxylesterase
MRGYGKSEPVAGAYYRHEDLDGLLTFLNIERAYLIGCSMGGRTVIDFALTYPEIAAALIPVAASPGGYEYTGKEPKQTVEIIAAFEKGDLERVSELEVQVWVDGPHRSADQIDPALRQLVFEMNLQALRYEKLDLGEEKILDTPAIRRLGDLKLPTLIISGDLDVPRIVMAGHVMQAQIPGAKKVVISGTAHLPNMEKPEDFNRAVLEFLQSL